MSNPELAQGSVATVGCPPVTGRLYCLLAFAGVILSAAMLLMGCTPNVGDHCALNTDCSLQGTLVCDNSQPNGYCTSFNCAPNTCPAGAACVMLYSAVPGCPYDGYSAPSRTQRTLCMKICGQNSDCRTGEGYECSSPASIDGVVIDDENGWLVCTVTPWILAPGPDAGAYPDAEAPVCMPEGPIVPPIQEAGAPDAGPGGG